MSDRHGKKELAVFRLFAPACGLPIELSSVEKRNPPEPDILCYVDGEGPVAFEMVELVDQKKIARPHADQLTLMNCLRDGYRNLPDRARGEFDRRLGNALVRAKIRSDLSLQKRKLIVGDILDHLMKVDADFAGSFAVNQGKTEVASVEVVRGNFGGPHFRVPTGNSYNPLPLDGLEAKFGKKYRCGAPVELLAYYDEQHAPLEDHIRELSRFIESRIVGSSFRRVWVFNVRDLRVCYRS